MASDSDRINAFPLGEFMSAEAADIVSIDPDTLLDLLGSLGPFAEPVRDLALLQLIAESDAPLELRLGKWQLDIARGTIQSAITTAILLPVCYTTGADDIPVVVLAAVLPFLVNIEEIQVQQSDLHVLASVREELFFPNDIEHVYKKLPDHLQHEITLLEFRDLVQRLTAAGRLKKNRLGRFQMTAMAFRETRSLLS